MRYERRPFKVEAGGYAERTTGEEGAGRVEEEVLLLDLVPHRHGRIGPERTDVREQQAAKREEVLLREGVCSMLSFSTGGVEEGACEEEGTGRTANDEPPAAVDEVLEQPDDVDAEHLLASPTTRLRLVVVQHGARLVLGQPFPAARPSPVVAHRPRAVRCCREHVAGWDAPEVPVIPEPRLSAACEARRCPDGGVVGGRRLASDPPAGRVAARRAKWRPRTADFWCRCAGSDQSRGREGEGHGGANDEGGESESPALRPRRSRRFGIQVGVCEALLCGIVRGPVAVAVLAVIRVRWRRGLARNSRHRREAVRPQRGVLPRSCAGLCLRQLAGQRAWETGDAP